MYWELFTVTGLGSDWHVLITISRISLMQLADLLSSTIIRFLNAMIVHLLCSVQFSCTFDSTNYENKQKSCHGPYSKKTAERNISVHSCAAKAAETDNMPWIVLAILRSHTRPQDGDLRVAEILSLLNNFMLFYGNSFSSVLLGQTVLFNYTLDRAAEKNNCRHLCTQVSFHECCCQDTNATISSILNVAHDGEYFSTCNSI